MIHTFIFVIFCFGSPTCSNLPMFSSEVGAKFSSAQECASAADGAAVVLQHNRGGDWPYQCFETNAR